MVKRDAQGRLYTVADPVPIDLAKARRECLDRIQGNEQFHNDPHSEQSVPVVQNETQPCACDCIAGLYLCDSCRDEAGY